MIPYACFCISLLLNMLSYDEPGESSGGATALTAARQAGTATTWRARSISSEVRQPRFSCSCLFVVSLPSDCHHHWDLLLELSQQFPSQVGAVR